MINYTIIALFAIGALGTIINMLIIAYVVNAYRDLSQVFFDVKNRVNERFSKLIRC